MLSSQVLSVIITLRVASIQMAGYQYHFVDMCTVKQKFLNRGRLTVELKDFAKQVCGSEFAKVLSIVLIGELSVMDKWQSVR